jgi:hypothetical protein
MTSPTPYQLLPRLSDEEYEALKNDIAENGVRVPIDVDEDGTILDGHHRAWITADLGIECPRRLVAGLNEEQKRTHAVAVNVHRRSLSREQRREVVARLRADGMTQQRISELTGIPQPTVSRDLNIQLNNEAAPATITNARGQERPAAYERRPEPTPQAEPSSDADLFAGEDWVQPEGPGFEQAVTPPRNPIDDFTDDERVLHKQLAAGETVVVSLRQHQRLIAWADERGIYERIDRRGPWGNPFELPADGDRDTVIANYENHYLPYKPSLLDRLHELKGKALGCWCAPEPCHGDILKNGADDL